MSKALGFIVCFFTLLLFCVYIASRTNETNLNKKLPTYPVAHRSWLPASIKIKKFQIENIFKENCTNPYSADWEKQNVLLNNEEVSFNAYKTGRTKEFIGKTANPFKKSEEPIQLRSYKVR